jgi:hypothetical protein
MVPWTACSESPCLASLTAQGGAGRDGSTGVKFHGEFHGKEKSWLVAGWRFDRWGDFTLDDAVTIWLRVEARSTSDSPPPEETWIALYRGSMQTSRKVLIHDCVADFADGHAHRVVIPISTLYQPGDGFDPSKAEGILFHLRSSTPRNFDIYVDDIELETLDKATSPELCRPAPVINPATLTDDPMSPLPNPPAASSPPEKPSEPGASKGPVVIHGQLHPTRVVATVRAKFPEFRYCYETKRPAAATSETVATRFVIGRDGKVTEVTDAGSTTPDGAVAACVRGVFSRTEFQAPKKGVVSVVYPLTFTP